MTRRSSAGMIGALWLAEITAAYGTSMIYAAMKALVAQFGDSVAVGWLVTGFLLIGSASAAVASRLGDLYGRRRVLLAMLLISGLGLLIGAVPPARTSEATGMMVVLRTMAMAAGAQIVAVLLASDTVSNPAFGKGSYPTEQAFMLTMAAVALVSVAATLVATALHRRPRRDPPPPRAVTA